MSAVLAVPSGLSVAVKDDTPLRVDGARPADWPPLIGLRNPARGDSRAYRRAAPRVSPVRPLNYLRAGCPLRRVFKPARRFSVGPMPPQEQDEAGRDFLGCGSGGALPGLERATVRLSTRDEKSKRCYLRKNYGSSRI
jgi:hypothetical protein